MNLLNDIFPVQLMLPTRILKVLSRRNYRTRNRQFMFIVEVVTGVKRQLQSLQIWVIPTLLNSAALLIGQEILRDKRS